MRVWKAMRNRDFMALSLCLLLILACNVASPSSSTAVPIPTVVTSIDISYAKISYYDVSGSTESEIREHLNALSPTGPDGYRGDALTTWDIRWTWEGYGSETCALKSVTVTYDIHIQFPRWTPSGEVSPELVTKWNNYILALVKHEKWHVDNVVTNLPKVVSAIRQGTCTTAEATGQAILTGIRKNDLDYDTRTNHGETQGAVFP